jgi:hypothetical protein
MTRPLFTCFALVLALAFITPSAAFADKRVALVIGNSAYRNVTFLTNPAKDANAMGALFRDAGFDDVRVANDLGVAEMKKELRVFSEKAADADVAVVFFAGHGMEMSGHNYLIPIDAVLQRDLDAEDETIDLDRILQLLEPAKRLKLVILDACRNNPFASKMKRTIAARAVGRGLAEPAIQTSDTLVAFAQRAGDFASDGAGDHSPYTSALLHHLTTPGLDLRIALGRVRDEVRDTTKRAQEPFIYGALGGDNLALVPGDLEPPKPRVRPPPTPMQPQPQVRLPRTPDPQQHQMKLPPGSYAYSCKSCRFDGRFLKCQCRTSGGQWLPTSAMDWGGSCNGQEVSNHEGVLVCAPR